MKRKNDCIKINGNLLKALSSVTFPIEDKKHGYLIYKDDGRARSNETRSEHILKKSHDLCVSDIQSIPNGIQNYIAYKKDKKRKKTFNYYINRKGSKKGFIKVSVRIDNKNDKKAWIKTIYTTYKIKELRK